MADGGRKLDATLTPIIRRKSSNPWANATFDDFDPASELDDIAGGQLYRMRRGSEHGQTQPVTRGGHHGGRRDANTGKQIPPSLVEDFFLGTLKALKITHEELP